MEQINKARGEASAILAKATANADGLKLLSNALSKQVGFNIDTYWSDNNGPALQLKPVPIVSIISTLKIQTFRGPYHVILLHQSFAQ